VKIINIVGARPNFMKIAPIMEAYKDESSIEPLLVHTGQHYDDTMSDLFFEQLGIPRPDINLDVGSATHASQTADIMKAFEPLLVEHKPDAVLVVGDVNSTIACGLVAVKMGIKLVHVEAGLRSFDRTMPEEINRLLTDAISDILFCTEESGVKNLVEEGVQPRQIFLVGNVMIDTLLKHQDKAESSDILGRLDLKTQRYAALTLHRPSNVDDPATLDSLLDVLEKIQNELPVVFPVHPRSRKSLADSGLMSRVEAMPALKLLDPMGYLDFLKLMSDARVVLTDSGGIQEETTILKVPCITLRENTERPSTVEYGTNTVVGRDPDKIMAAFRKAIELTPGEISSPPFWDGHASRRIVQILKQKLA